jgi:hypothetical protein
MIIPFPKFQIGQTVFLNNKDEINITTIKAARYYKYNNGWFYKIETIEGVLVEVAEKWLDYYSEENLKFKSE